MEDEFTIDFTNKPPYLNSNIQVQLNEIILRKTKEFEIEINENSFIDPENDKLEYFVNGVNGNDMPEWI